MEYPIYLGRIDIPVPDWLVEFVFNIIVEIANFFAIDIVKRMASNTTEEFWYSLFVLGITGIWIIWIKNKLEEIMDEESDRSNNAN